MKELFQRNSVLLFFTVLFLSLSSCTVPPPAEEPYVLGNHYIEHGRTLAHGLASCGFCHGDQPKPTSVLSGGQVLNDIYGEVTAPNLSAVHLQQWNTKDIVRAMRQYKRKDDENIAVEHHAGYEWMSDEDAFSIAAYIKSLPSIDRDTETRSLSTLSKYTSGLLEQRLNVEGYVPPIPKLEKRSYGKYLVENVARCTACHNTPSGVFNEAKYLEGGKEFNRYNKTAVAPNITGSEVYGIGEWSEKEIAHYLQSGISPGGRRVDSRFCPVEFYQSADPNDLLAIAHYLRSVETS